MEGGQLATDAFKYTSGSLGACITGMDEAVLQQRHPLRFRVAPYPSPMLVLGRLRCNQLLCHMLSSELTSLKMLG